MQPIQPVQPIQPAQSTRPLTRLLTRALILLIRWIPLLFTTLFHSHLAAHRCLLLPLQQAQATKQAQEAQLLHHLQQAAQLPHKPQLPVPLATSTLLLIS